MTVDDCDATVVGATEVDVVLGRGKRFDLHPGNIAFRQIVWSHRSDYQQSRCVAEKKNIAAVVVDTVVDRGGRFLMQTDNDDDEYVVVSTTRAREKASQCLRERHMRDPTPLTKTGRGRGRQNRTMIAKTVPPSTKRAATKKKSKKAVLFKGKTKASPARASSFRNSYKEEETQHGEDSIVNLLRVVAANAATEHKEYFCSNQITLDDALAATTSNLKNTKETMGRAVATKVPPPTPKPLITFTTFDDLFAELETMDSDLSSLLDATLGTPQAIPGIDSSPLDDDVAVLESVILPGVTHDLCSPYVPERRMVAVPLLGTVGTAPVGKQLVDGPFHPATTTKASVTTIPHWPSPIVGRSVKRSSISSSSSNPVFRLLHSDIACIPPTAATTTATTGAGAAPHKTVPWSGVTTPVVAAGTVGWQGPSSLAPPTPSLSSVDRMPSGAAAAVISPSPWSTTRVDPYRMTMDDWAALLREPLYDPPPGTAAAASIMPPSNGGYNACRGGDDLDDEWDEFDPMQSWNDYLHQHCHSDSANAPLPHYSDQHHHQ